MYVGLTGMLFASSTLPTSLGMIVAAIAGNFGLSVRDTVDNPGRVIVGESGEK